MKFTLGTKKVEPPPAKVAKVKKEKNKQLKQKRESLSKRRKESEAILFGSELFEPIHKKEKEVVIHFPEKCTDEGIYISKCGGFGYRHSQNEFYFELYYFKNPILEYESTLIIIPSDEIWLFENLNPEELEDLACKLKRAEFAREREDEKVKLLNEIREAERLRQEELDRADEEFLNEQEKEAEQLALELEELKNINDVTKVVQETELAEPIVKPAQRLEPTLNEISAVEAKIKQATEEIKPKSGFQMLPFGKVNK